MENRLVTSLMASKDVNNWPFGTPIVSIKLNFHVIANPRTKRFLLWGHLGEGGSGRVVLASDTNGRVCAIKLYLGGRKQLAKIMAEADEECRLFKIAYGSYEWSNNFRVLQFGACVGLVMPHFCAFHEKDRSNLLKDVEKTLTNFFLQKRLRYDDIKWHRIMRFRDGDSAHIVVVDMGQCVEGDIDGKWIQEHIRILRKRLPVTSYPRKLDFSPDSSES